MQNPADLNPPKSTVFQTKIGFTVHSLVMLTANREGTLCVVVSVLPRVPVLRHIIIRLGGI
jgi:hypothetical protein